MKFLFVLSLLCISAFALEQESELLDAFPESWYDAESTKLDDEVMLPHFIDAEEDMSEDFGASRFDDNNNQNVLQVAEDLGATVFVKCVCMAGLRDVFANTPNITVFVPSNRAFARLPRDVFVYFMRHLGRFAAVLKNHAVNGTYKIEDLQDDSTYNTLLKNLTLRYDSYNHTNSNYTTRVVQAAKISCRKDKVDNVATNGMVHIIDEVIVKLPFVSAYYVVSRSPHFSSLYNGLVVANMSDSLKGNGPLTLFAPTEKAIKKLPAGVWESLLKDPASLTAVLDLHVVPKTIYARGLKDGDVLNTLNRSNSLTVAIREKDHGRVEVSVNGSIIVYFDGAVTNGDIHAIDRVIIPPKIMEKLMQ